MIASQITFPLRSESPSGLASIRDFLRRAGFDDNTMCRVLRIDRMSDLGRVSWDEVDPVALPPAGRWALRVFIRGLPTGLEIAREIYGYAILHVDEFCAPYASVIDINKKKLPSAAEVSGWSSKQFVSALRHDQKNPAYNSSFRQLLHVSFKVAAKMGDRYCAALKKHEAVIAKNVTENLLERHIKPLLLETRKQVRSSPRLEAVPA